MKLHRETDFTAQLAIAARLAQISERLDAMAERQDGMAEDVRQLHIRADRVDPQGRPVSEADMALAEEQTADARLSHMDTPGAKIQRFMAMGMSPDMAARELERQAASLPAGGNPWLKVEAPDMTPAEKARAVLAFRNDHPERASPEARPFGPA